ncbi:hypothetical protein N7536_008990 [Penicillium majusculum]|nr:hypothetical protein N7536_008990 [Penicillium majusculum]
MLDKLIFPFNSYFSLSAAILTIRHRRAHSSGQRKGGSVMNSVATNLIWMVVVCFWAEERHIFGCCSGCLTVPFLLSSGSGPRPASARARHVSAYESCSIPATLNCGGS